MRVYDVCSGAVVVVMRVKTQHLAEGVGDVESANVYIMQLAGDVESEGVPCLHGVGDVEREDVPCFTWCWRH